MGMRHRIIIDRSESIMYIVSIEGVIMPAISMFFGIIIRMFYRDNQQHHAPHIHAEYQGEVGVFAIEDGGMLDGSLPPAKRKLVEAWIVNTPR
jgi:hypothetical protein